MNEVVVSEPNIKKSLNFRFGLKIGEQSGEKESDTWSLPLLTLARQLRPRALELNLMASCSLSTILCTLDIPPTTIGLQKCLRRLLVLLKVLLLGA